jgi:radical SAM superfamily enzyme YgiQ (UPF0313 family)
MLKIFLGDLVHDWEKVSLWTFPLNIGYMASHTLKAMPGDVEFRLFKRPEAMIAAIRQENPDVVGLSHYVWNANLSALIFRLAKEHNPKVLTVGGGPIFTSLNANEAGGHAFFAEKSPHCDVYVVNQGERGFTGLIKRFSEVGGDLERLRKEAVPGCLVNDLQGRNRVLVGETIEAYRELDEIPSPYLTGLMDPFFAEPFVPILETNRSCPYRCTFCAWGIGSSKLANFSDERVFAEIDYIAERCTKSMNLFIVDANFGILERDAAIAAKVWEVHEKYGYPGHVGCQWNKSRPDRVLKAAMAFRGLSEVGASMQTFSLEVLEAIKRKNLPLEQVLETSRALREAGLQTTLFSELIVGLPSETAASHLAGNRILMDAGAEIFNYNLHLLPGTDMDTAASRQAYFKRTGWRLHDNAFGIYDGVSVFEGQEVVLETNAMSMEELRGFRLIHFLIQFMWSRKWYMDFLQLFAQAGVHPIEMIVRVAEALRLADGEIGELYGRFKQDHDLENFSTYQELCDYWSGPENMERLRQGKYGKINYVFTYEILLGHYEAFNHFLMNVARRAMKEMGLANAEATLDQCAEILNFTAELRVALTQELDSVVASKRKSFRYDLLAWRTSGYSGPPARISTSDRYDCEFFLTDRQKSMLERQLAQFRSNNANLTLRKMSEEMSADDFFYQVRSVEAAE